MAILSINGVAPRYMNTYRLEPKKRFNGTEVRAILEEVVVKHCFGVKYEPSKSSLKVQAMAEEILSQVKKLQFDRYRLIVFVQIISNKRQELETGVKFLWDAERDTMATYCLPGGSSFVVATCFGIYKD